MWCSFRGVVRGGKGSVRPIRKQKKKDKKDKIARYRFVQTQTASCGLIWGGR